MILAWILLALSVPVGLWIAWLARDELIDGRKWFLTISILCLIIGVYFSIRLDKVVLFSLASIFIVSMISYLLSYKKGWAIRAFK